MIKKYLVSPFEKFIKTESSSGLLLLLATVVALIWANSPWAEAYYRLWDYKLSVGIGNLEISKTLFLWINDGLMSVFFFLIGLEIKREVLIGELNSFKKASLPLFAALGGIVVPVGLFLLLNQDTETTKGWGIPMATDIAFSLAVLKALGKRVPLVLMIFLTALAIVDDLGAVLSIAIFYSSDINWMLIAYSIAPFALLVLLNIKNGYHNYLFLAFGILIWTLFLKSGIHPTIAGILIAFTIPLRQKTALRTNTDKLKVIVSQLDSATYVDNPILTKEQIYALDDLKDWTAKVSSPLQNLEHSLHGWVAFLIIPLFALANGGIAFDMKGNLDLSLALNITLALILGKSIGITLFSLIATKFGISTLPNGITVWRIIGAGFLAGIGFTMSIFITNLAFVGEADFIASAKIGVLIGSVLAALTGFLILKKSTSE